MLVPWTKAYYEFANIDLCYVSIYIKQLEYAKTILSNNFAQSEILISW